MEEVDLVVEAGKNAGDGALFGKQSVAETGSEFRRVFGEQRMT